MTAAPLAARRMGIEDERAARSVTADSVIRAEGVVRSFGAKRALDGLSIDVPAGEIHALVGPNGAGKTTLLRVLTGLVQPDDGLVRVLGLDPFTSPRGLRRRIGVVPSGTRSFYLRISGFENLLFFARLYGLRYRAAAARASAALEAVDLSEARDNAVSTYSTGMQRRLAIARATLHEPDLLLIDEATHDLDPEAATLVRGLVDGAAKRGAAVVWTTQRLEEIKGFAHAVTLIDAGSVRFAGTVPQLVGLADRRTYLVTVEGAPPELLMLAGELVASLAASGGGEDGHYVLTLAPRAVLGDALDLLSSAGVRVTGCSEARPSVEEAFLSVVERGRA